jgi:hypothetical protein
MKHDTFGCIIYEQKRTALSLHRIQNLSSKHNDCGRVDRNEEDEEEERWGMKYEGCR